MNYEEPHQMALMCNLILIYTVAHYVKHVYRVNKKMQILNITSFEINCAYFKPFLSLPKPKNDIEASIFLQLSSNIVALFLIPDVLIS